MTDRRELKACYTSTHPDVWAAVAENDRRYAEYSELCRKWREDYPDRQLYETHSSGGIQFAGFGWPRPGPEWRENRNVWVPYKSKAKGNPDLVRRFEETRMRFEPLPGMPNDVFSGWGISQPGWHRHEEGVLWVVWTCSHELVKADLDIWTLRRPSEYYASKEAAEERDEPATDA